VNKVLSIQILRGVAASMVCWSHFMLPSRYYLPDGNWAREIGEYSLYGVQIFFVISGFILPYSLFHSDYSIHKFGKFLLRRVVRLEPPYIVSIVVVILLAYVSMLSPLYRGKPYVLNWQDVALHLGYLSAFFNRPWLSPVYWTLAIEFQFYLILGLLYPAFKQSGNATRALMVGVFFVSGLFFRERAYIFCHAPIFFMGILTFLFYEKKIGLNAFVPLIAVSFVTACFSFSLDGAIFGIIAVPAILLISSKNRVLLFLGNISYSIYLLHVPIGTRITNLTEALTDSVSIRIIAGLVAFIVTIGISFIYYKLIELPAIKWAKRLSEEKPLNTAQ
jgi:peptidoglycan/LPS O-acetylase OafA/YrhL